MRIDRFGLKDLIYLILRGCFVLGSFLNGLTLIDYLHVFMYKGDGKWRLLLNFIIDVFADLRLWFN